MPVFRAWQASLPSQLIVYKLHFVQNDFGGSFPLERGGVPIPGGEPGVNGGFQFTGAVEGSAPNHAVRDEGEEALHLIEPGTAGGSEVELESPSVLWLEPALDFGALVGAVVIHD